MRSNRKNIRLDFSPLITTCAIHCVSPQSPAMQVHNAHLSEWEPDRSLTPLVLQPVVNVRDPDGVFVSGCINNLLSINAGDLNWYVNGKEISTVSAFIGYFSVNHSDGDNRGRLTITKNMQAGTSYVLSFKGKFLDFRTGTTIEVSSENAIVIGATDVGDDVWAVTVDHNKVEYDPLKDNLLVYDHLSANGITDAAFGSSRGTYRDANAFERDFHFVLNTGGNVYNSSLPTGVTMKLFYVGSDSEITANSATSPEVTVIAFPLITIDMRLIEKKEYEARFYKSGAVLAKTTISVKRKMSPIYKAEPDMGSDIAPGQTMYYNRVTVSLAQRMEPYAELFWDIVWYTQAVVKSGDNYVRDTEKVQGYGPEMLCEVKKIGIGQTRNDNYFDILVDLEPREAACLLTDEDGDILTDESGNYLID